MSRCTSDCRSKTGFEHRFWSAERDRHPQKTHCRRSSSSFRSVIPVQDPGSVRTEPRFSLFCRTQNEVLGISLQQALPEDVPVPVTVGIEEERLPVVSPGRGQIVSSLERKSPRWSQPASALKLGQVQIALQSRVDEYQVFAIDADAQVQQRQAGPVRDALRGSGCLRAGPVNAKRPQVHVLVVGRWFLHRVDDASVGRPAKTAQRWSGEEGATNTTRQCHRLNTRLWANAAGARLQIGDPLSVGRPLHLQKTVSECALEKLLRTLAAGAHDPKLGLRPAGYVSRMRAIG